MKERITITIDRGLLEWLDSKVSGKIFANRSHGFEFLIFDERKESNGEAGQLGQQSNEAKIIHSEFSTETASQNKKSDSRVKSADERKTKNNED